MAKKPLVKTPLGSGYGSPHDWIGGFGCDRDNSGPVVCELCGTEHPQLPGIDPEDDDIELDDYVYHLFDLFGYTVVYECCGRVFDRMFKRWGQTFAHAHIRDAAKDPTSHDFRCLSMVVESAIQQAKKKLQEGGDSVERLAGAINLVQGTAPTARQE